MRSGSLAPIVVLVLTFLFMAVSSGCVQLRLPQIDPTGNSIFLPPGYSTELLTPGSVANRNNPLRQNPFGQRPLRGNGLPSGVLGPPVTPAPAIPQNNYPVPPAFTHPADPPPCDANQGCARGCNAIGCSSGNRLSAKKHVIPHPGPAETDAERGQILLTPSRIVAPVGSEVVVLAGICGGDGYYALNQPLEWMLSNDSVGQFIEIGGTNGPHPTFNKLLPPSSKKIDGSYAWGRTGLKDILLTRGTPTPADDIQLLKGQTFVSVSSESPGTSYVTSVAPKAAAWDKRRESTVIHWVDGVWAVPVPTLATAGTVHPMTTRVNRSSDGTGVKDWQVRYTILGGAPAEFAPTGSQTAFATTNETGEATAQLRQIAGRFEPGTTQVRVDVIRPAMFGQPELQVESGVTSVTWSAPALTLRAIGPRNAGTNEAFNYRIEVSNPGDQVSRGVVVRTQDFGGNVEFISSTPKPTQYGNRYEWQLGDIPPGAGPAVINIQLKSMSPGNVSMCYEVESLTDGLQTEACAQTEVSAPCIGLEIEGPTTVNVGQEADFEILIVNQCNEPLNNLELVVNYDNGLLATGLGNPIRFPIQQLRFGEPRKVPLTFEALQPGQRCFRFTVTADGGHTADGERCLDAVIPVDARLGIKVEGNAQTTAGQPAQVRGTVFNSGNSPLENVVVTVRQSDSLQISQVTDAYPRGMLGRDMAFNIGRLDPGQEAAVVVEYSAIAQDPNAFSEMTVTSSTGSASDTGRFGINVGQARGPVGIPRDNRPLGGGSNGGGPDTGSLPGNGAQPGDVVRPSQVGDLVIDVRSLSQEIQVGELVTFEFFVTNDRQIPDQRVLLSMLIPPGLEYHDFDPTEGGLPIVSRNGFNEFRLEERREMRPGERLRFTMTMRATEPGVPTFEVQGTSANTAGTAFGRDTVTVRQ